MDNLQKAVQYCFDNPTLSIHHIARKFGVKSSELQVAYRKKWYNSKKIIA